ncbi:MAG: hypothetical protein M1527_02020 [Gammaproteobacteria bacterium]|nr:hypothetical protein [Gammaproteobacteria bacterium]
MLIIAAIVFVAGVAIFGARAEASAADGIPPGFRFDPLLGGYTKTNPDGSLVYLF